MNRRKHEGLQPSQQGVVGTRYLIIGGLQSTFRRFGCKKPSGVSPPDKLYEVTLTTRQDRYFHIPIPKLNWLMIGVLAYRQRKYS